MHQEQENLVSLAVRFLRQHENEMRRVAELKPTVTEVEYRVMEKELRRLMVRVETVKARLELSKNMSWWINQVLRSFYRRKSIMEGLKFQKFKN